MVQFDEDKQNIKLKQLRKSEEEGLVQHLAQKHGLQYLDLTALPINTDALRLVPEEEARNAKLAVFQKVNKDVRVAVLSPEHPGTKETIQSLQERGYNPTLFMVSNTSLDRAWGRYKDITFASESKRGLLDVSNEDILEFLGKVESLDGAKEQIKETLSLGKAHKVSRIVEIILAGALATKASDIHIEPQESQIRLRFRLDGILEDVLNFDRETYELLLSRIKLLSGLKLNIKKDAQDGRFSIKIDNTEIEIRTSVLPGEYGEAIVLRILNPKTISVPMNELGMEPDLLSIIQREIKKPNGMMLNTGPTGSGKTTTLYAFLSEIHTPSVKIITIEDPVEYHLKGIVQTQVNTKENYTFSEGLRSSLRQDPDVIMVGEMRDKETAEVAINAALTGHLVFSTLHTNNAAGTFPRLIDLGVNPKIIGSAVNVSMAQRLVRKICPDCKKEVVLEGAHKKFVDEVVPGINPSKLEGLDTTKAFSGVGCEKCNGTGYKGRIGVFEAILVDEAVEKAIKENPGEREIWRAAEAQGIPTMTQDGVLKVLKGVTSMEELMRVVGLEE